MQHCGDKSINIRPLVRLGFVFEGLSNLADDSERRQRQGSQLFRVDLCIAVDNTKIAIHHGAIQDGGKPDCLMRRQELTVLLALQIRSLRQTVLPQTSAVLHKVGWLVCYHRRSPPAWP